MGYSIGGEANSANDAGCFVVGFVKLAVLPNEGECAKINVKK